MRVLSVLNNLFFYEKIREAAAGLGHQTDLATNLTEASQKAAESPDLVILDLAFPDVLGWLEAQKSSHPELPVLAFISHVDTRTRDQALAAGCDRVVPKSVFSQKLPELIRELAQENRGSRI